MPHIQAHLPAICKEDMTFFPQCASQNNLQIKRLPFKPHLRQYMSNSLLKLTSTKVVRTLQITCVIFYSINLC